VLARASAAARECCFARAGLRTSRAERLAAGPRFVLAPRVERAGLRCYEAAFVLTVLRV